MAVSNITLQGTMGKTKNSFVAKLKRSCAENSRAHLEMWLFVVGPRACVVRKGIFSREANSDALSPALAGRAAEGEGGGWSKKNQCPCSRFELFFSPRLQKRVVSLN